MPSIPIWAKKQDSLFRNLNSAKESLLPRPVKARSMYMPVAETKRVASPVSPVFDEDIKALPTPISLEDDSPIPTTALMNGVINAEQLKEYNAATSSASVSAPTPTIIVAQGQWPGLDDLIAPTGHMDAEFMQAQTLAQTLLISNNGDFLQETTMWYERTSTHIIGMIVLMLVAVFLVELYEKIGGCFCRRRRRSGKLRLKGQEKQLWVEDDIEGSHCKDSDDVEEEGDQDFWSS